MTYIYYFAIGSVSHANREHIGEQNCKKTIKTQAYIRMFSVSIYLCICADDIRLDV